jgi:hypothetical protein
MRPISLIDVHRWPFVVSIFNVTRFDRAMRGPLNNFGITWNRVEKFALAWEIAQIRARKPLRCLRTGFHATDPKPVSTRGGPDSR